MAPPDWDWRRCSPQPNRLVLRSFLLAVGAFAPAVAGSQDAPSRRAAPDTTQRAPADSARARSLETVTVRAVRGGDATTAQTTLDRPALARAYTGQDVPMMLQQAPAVTTYSESGSPWNYSYFRLRGIAQSRINLTLDGIPLNEPEDQQLYFSDFPDLGSSLQSVQIQRGVGTSTYGQSSFGGSVNFETVPLATARRGAELQLGAGSFGARRATAEYASGLQGGRTAVYARFSNQRADGYRRGSSHAGNGAMLSAGYFGDRDLLKLTVLTGAESNGQAYTAVPLAELRVDRRANPIDGVGDRFRESMAALTYTRVLSPSATLATTVYGFRAGGWYEYPTYVEGTPDPRWDLASRWGGVLSALHATRGRATVDAGLHALTYSRDHTFRERADLDAYGYDNRGYKSEGSAFAKAGYALGAVSLFGDLTLREAAFRYRPTAGAGLPGARTSWRFVNPRVGASWQTTPATRVFASVGATGREPTRADLLAGADDIGAADVDSLLPLSRVRPEHVRDVELGSEWRGATVQLRANAYAMDFRDEIALTGLATPLGYDVRRNVGRSYRRGVEVEASWQPLPALALGGTAALSRNRVRTLGDGTPTDVPTVLSPSLIAGQQLTWRVARPVSLTLDGRYQSRQYLDPTGDRVRTASAYYVLDGGARFMIGGQELLVQGRNLLDRLAYPSGNVSSRGVPRYFVLAPRSVEVTARLRL